MIHIFLILFKILMIFQEYKGAQCANAISKYIHVFNMDTFDEFNLICYISMYTKLLMTINYIQENPSLPPNNLIFDDIHLVNFKLLRVNSWKKYLNEPGRIWNDFDNITNWSKNTNNAELTKTVLHDVMSTTNLSKFNDFNWMTPKGKKLYEILMMNLNEKIEKMLHTTFEFCKVTLNTLSTPSSYLEKHLHVQFKNSIKFETPVPVIHGCVILLFKNENFKGLMYKENMISQSMSLVYIINQALQDVYLGIEYILSSINSQHFQTPELRLNPGNYTNIQLIKMIITVYYNAVNLTEELFFTKDIKGVKEKLYKLNQAKHNLIKVYYSYNSFQAKFQIMLSNLFSPKSQDDKSGPSTLSDGRLITNGRVDPPIIGYYAVFEESWENMGDIDYVNNTDDRIVFLMELNAWTTVLYQTLQNLRSILLPKGLCDILSRKPNFAYDKNSIKQYELMFQ